MTRNKWVPRETRQSRWSWELYPCLWTKFCFMNQPVLVCWVLHSVCVHMWNSSKEIMFVCSIGKEKYPLFKSALRMYPLWGALTGPVGSFALSLFRSSSLCLLNVPTLAFYLAFSDSGRRSPDFSHCLGLFQGTWRLQVPRE